MIETGKQTVGTQGRVRTAFVLTCCPSAQRNGMSLLLWQREKDREDLSQSCPPSPWPVIFQWDLDSLLGFYLGGGGLNQINNLISMHSKRNNRRPKINEEGPSEYKRRAWENWNHLPSYMVSGDARVMRRGRRKQMQRRGADPGAWQQNRGKPDTKALGGERFCVFFFFSFKESYGHINTI